MPTDIKRFYDSSIGLATDLGNSLAMPNMYKTRTRQLCREGLVKRVGNRYAKTSAGHAVTRAVYQAMHIANVSVGFLRS